MYTTHQNKQKNKQTNIILLFKMLTPYSHQEVEDIY